MLKMLKCIINNTLKAEPLRAVVFTQSGKNLFWTIEREL